MSEDLLIPATVDQSFKQGCLEDDYLKYTGLKIMSFEKLQGQSQGMFSFKIKGKW